MPRQRDFWMEWSPARSAKWWSSRPGTTHMSLALTQNLNSATARLEVGSRTGRDLLRATMNISPGMPTGTSITLARRRAILRGVITATIWAPGILSFSIPATIASRSLVPRAQLKKSGFARISRPTRWPALLRSGTTHSLRRGTHAAIRPGSSRSGTISINRERTWLSADMSIITSDSRRKRRLVRPTPNPA